jgi:transglutaminase-like putative cysteine protease
LAQRHPQRRPLTDRVLIVRISRPPCGWTSVVLVASMLLTVAWSIQAAEYAPGLDILTAVVVGGVVAGVLLGTQRWLPSTLAHGWSLLMGTLFTAFLGTHVLRAYLPDDQIAARSTLERMVVVRDWYIGWAGSAGGGTFARDDPVVPFAFVLTMAFLMWLLSYICTWFIVRYLSWWGAVLPSGFALLFNLYQAPEARVGGLAFFLACALLLAEQTHLTLQIDAWRRARIGYSPDIGLDFLRDGLVVVLVVVGLSWLAPTNLDNQWLRSYLRGFTESTRGVEQRVNRLFPNLKYPARAGGSAFGDTMPLGGSIQLGSRVIFDATIEDPPVEPRYFRMAVFDTYDGAGWSRTPDTTVEGAAPDLARDDLLTAPVTQTIRTYQDATEQLFAMPQPARFSVPVRAELAGDKAALDVLTVEALSPLAVADTYQVVSRQSVADVALLREAGTDDPPWVRARYVQLPATVPERVRRLAAAITNGSGTRFDAADMIEAYLRHNYVYSESIDTPPAQQDRADWFLFDEQRGYCDYYSTAFVVLARSVGIPARMAAGYSRGEYVREAAALRQHESDAHTWPEVYFPRYGWIEFEPTAADARIARPVSSEAPTPEASAVSAETGSDTDLLPPDDPRARDQGAGGTGATGSIAGAALSRWALPVLAVLAACGLALLTGAVWWRRPLQGLSAAEGTFARLARVAGWLGLAPRVVDTPHEYASRLGAAIPEGRADIAAVVDSYVRERFGRQSSEGQSEMLRRVWRRLRGVLARAAGRLGARRLRKG